MALNTAAVAATVTVGIGYTQLKELFGGMNIHCFCDKSYKKYQNYLHDKFLETVNDSLKKAGEEERRLAIERGDVTSSGIPFITVVTDGSWRQRTYGTNYNSPSGYGNILGWHTGKILFIAPRNKYCIVCARAHNLNKIPKKHTCFKNWSSKASSTGMESDGILEGFRKSIETHGLIYKTIITDADSSVYKAICDSNVYVDHNVIPLRILCTNHLLRNLCKKLRIASKTTQPKGNRTKGFVQLRSVIRLNIANIRNRVEELVAKRVSENRDWEIKIEELRKDILNIPSCIVGEHRACQEQGDDCKQREETAKQNNYVDDMKKVGLYQKVEAATEYLSQYSESLLHRVTNNIAEQYNSSICPYLGGKRIHFGLTNQYNTRVSAAAVQFNSQECLIDLHKTMRKKISKHLKFVTMQRIRRVLQTKNRRRMRGRKKKINLRNMGDKDYGNKHHDVDKSLKQMDEEKTKLINQLRENQKNREKIERDTIQQRNSELWKILRRKLLTASNFKLASISKTDKSCAAKVKQILYPFVTDEAYISYGIQQEKVAKDELNKQFNNELRKCGLFIDSKYPMLACSPDALIGEGGLVEIKCPYNAANMTAEEAVKKDKRSRQIFHPKDIEKINKNHEYYYQIQGQLHITKREYCLLVIHTPHSRKIFRINVDHDFWKSKMEKQLVQFYMDCMLPEIVDSRYNRSMPIRNPQYTMTAIQENKKKSKKVTRKFMSSYIDDNEPEFKRSKIETDEDVAFVSHICRVLTPEEIERFKNLFDNRVINIQEVTDHVSTPGSWLNDDDLDYFIRLLQTVDSDLITQSTNYIPSGQCIDPIYTPSYQIIGGTCINHWRCVYFDGEILYVYDSNRQDNHYHKHRYSLSETENQYISCRFPTIQLHNIIFQPMLVKQPDGNSCGLYAAAFAETLASGGDPLRVRYSTNSVEMRRHFLEVVTSGIVRPFPRQI